jgi:hypothetical protein
MGPLLLPTVASVYLPPLSALRDGDAGTETTPVEVCLQHHSEVRAWPPCGSLSPP